MRNKFSDTVSFLQVCTLFVTACFAENPIIQTNYTADPAPLVYNDTMFLYTSHDEDSASGFVMFNWLLYTTTDMVNWRDRGVVASLADFSWAGSENAWAPQCVFRNGKFYLYCPVYLKGIGVLVADNPCGPFTDPLGKPLFYHSTNDIDPTVFIDDDGQAYMYWGNPVCYYIKLNQDMISYSGAIDSISPVPDTYQEGPWLYKRNNNYYLAFASSCCPEGIGYATSDSPTGPWTNKGYVMRPHQYSSLNHPGIIDYKGNSYVFGFDYELLFYRQATRTQFQRRSVCVAAMTYNDNGTIKNVPWWGTSVPGISVPQISYLNPYDTTQAETICWEEGVRTEACADTGGGMDVDSIHSGDYIKVKGVDFGNDSAKSFETRVASATSGGNIELHLDTVTGTLAGTCSVKGTGGWQTWTTISCDVAGATGVHDLYFKFTGDSGLLFNFNWWKFTAVETGIILRGAQGAARASAIKTIIDAGKTPMLHIDFSEPVLRGYLHVCLFDLTGRLTATLFAGQLPASHIAVPLNGMEIRSGIYCLRIMLENRTILTKAITLTR